MQLGSLNTRWRSAVSWGRKQLSFMSPRRLVFLVIFLLILLYHMLPYLYHTAASTFTSYSFASESCSDRFKERYARELSEHDAVVSDVPDMGTSQAPDDHHFPFVGNGMIGSSLLPPHHSSLYIYHKPLDQPKTKLISLGAKVLVSVAPAGGEKLLRHDAYGSDFRRGVVELMSCYPFDRLSRKRLRVSHQIIAHRSRPNVLLQRVHVTLERRHTSSSSSSSGEDKVMMVVQHDRLDTTSPFLRAKFPPGSGKKTYKLYSYTLAVGEKSYMSVVLAVSNLPDTINLQDEATVDSITVVMKSEVCGSKMEAGSKVGKLVEESVTYMDQLLLTPTKSLMNEHIEAWRDILHTGLTINTAPTQDQLLPPGIPDPALVNATLYYILSSMDSKLHDKGIDLKERRDLMKRLKTPNFCYTGVATFHVTSKLWRKVASPDDVIDLANMWALTLRYKGCANLVDEGAEGMLQAVVLSFGGLQFTNNDLQLHTDPDILHNEIAFHNVMYRDSTVDVAINNRHSGQVSISVSVRNASNEPLYACEAGCTAESRIVVVDKRVQQVPVYVTRPPSPILYLSYDRQHLVHLHETLHLASIVRYEEHWESSRQNRGLPTIFWIGIGSLILLFHIFLVRLLVKEYYSSSSSSRHNPVLPGSGPYIGGLRSRLAS